MSYDYTKGQEVYIHLQVEHTTYVGTMFHITPVYLTRHRDTDSEDKPTWFRDEVWDIDTYPYRYYLRGLGIHIFAMHIEPYQCKIEYKDMHTLDTNKLQHMLRTMKSIDKKVDTWNNKHGAPLSAGQACVRFANIIGASGLVYEKKFYHEACDITPAHDNGYVYRVEELRYAAEYIDKILGYWKEKEQGRKW